MTSSCTSSCTPPTIVDRLHPTCGRPGSHPPPRIAFTPFAKGLWSNLSVRGKFTGIVSLRQEARGPNRLPVDAARLARLAREIFLHPDPVVIWMAHAHAHESVPLL